MNITTVPIIDGIKYEARCLQNAISGIQAGRKNLSFADSELELAERTERLFKLLDYFGNRGSGEERINGLEEERRLVAQELDYLEGKPGALTEMCEEAGKIYACPEMYVDLKRINGDLYNVVTGRFLSS